jgi:hypothetical protein
MDTTTKRHPIRGFLYGIFFGLGFVLSVVGQGMAALGTWPPLIVFVIGVLAATLWAIAGPVKEPKGSPPAGAALVDAEPLRDAAPIVAAHSSEDGGTESATSSPETIDHPPT